MRLATGGIAHETNTFAARLTTIDDFRSRGGFPALTVGPPLLEALRGSNSCTGGFIEAAEEVGAELVPLIWTFAQPSGTVQQAAYDELIGLLVGQLQEALPVDGVLLDLHGAMVTQGLEDAEGDILKRVRAVVGAETPLVATLDLHANITPAMAAAADALIGYDTYPHVDCAERGAEALGILAGMLRGGLRPVSGFAQVDMLIGPPKQCTLIPPMRDVFALVHEIERRPGIIAVTLSGGFAFADIRDAGASVVVHADGDAGLAQATAEEIAAHLWERRDGFRVEVTPVREAVREALAGDEGTCILADGSDNPGGGAPCDGTVMLGELVEALGRDGGGGRQPAAEPVATVAIIADPEAVAQAVEVGVGRTATLTVGGKTDGHHGEPLTLSGHVRLISDGNYRNRGPMMTGLPVAMGRTVVFVVGGVEVLLTERRVQPFDMQALRSVGIEPSQRRVIGLKSAVHFRADYGPIATRIFDLDTPGIHNPDVTRYDYRRLRRPMWPLDE